MPLPLKSDPALTDAPAFEDDGWLQRAREQIDRANAAMPEIVAEMNAEYRASRIGKGRRPPRPLDPNYDYFPGFEEDWTVE
jgi:hypothetical protein